MCGESFAVFLVNGGEIAPLDSLGSQSDLSGSPFRGLHHHGVLNYRLDLRVNLEFRVV